VPKKVFFHISDMIEGLETQLKIGDEVEFILSHNSRSGKYSAVKIRTIGADVSNSNSSSAQAANAEQDSSLKRERLNAKLKVLNIDEQSGKQLILIRQPNNPDAKVKSFSRQLRERFPGSLLPISPSSNNLASITSETINSSGSSQPNETKPQQSISPLSIMELLIANNSASTSAT
jgi:hypothetical protein